MTWCCELEELNKFIQESKPGEIFKYCTACSVQDTIVSKEIGKLVYVHSTKGLCYLYQKRSINYYFDFDHFIIKASSPPVYSLVPLADEKTEELRRKRGARNYVHHQRVINEGLRRHHTV